MHRLAPRAHQLRIGDIVVQRTTHVEKPARDVVEFFVERAHVAIERVARNIPSQLPTQSITDDGGVGVETDMNCVLAINAICKSVVCADGRNVQVVISFAWRKPFRRQLADSCANAGAQLTGCFARKCETENFVRCDVTVGDEPHDSSGHRLGLSAPRSRNDKCGLTR